MEEWRRLVEKVPGDLRNVAVDTGGLLGAVAVVRAKLEPWAAAPVRDEQARRGIGDNPVALLGAKHASLPAEDLDRAVGSLARLAALHARAGHAFLLYGRRAGLEGGGGGDERWQGQGWKLQHARAGRYAAAALRRVRVAASQARAFEDAVRSARAFPLNSPGWNYWMAAAGRLVACAAVSTRMALNALVRMLFAVVRENRDVRLILRG